ncbi:MAG: hypothetical protein KF893_24860 [Caldilineaceae bacterium]|nr:hypothetical protein [Caldilineaceae bacterium]
MILQALAFALAVADDVHGILVSWLIHGGSFRVVYSEIVKAADGTYPANGRRAFHPMTFGLLCLRA